LGLFQDQNIETLIAVLLSILLFPSISQWVIRGEAHSMEIDPKVQEAICILKDRTAFWFSSVVSFFFLETL